MKKIGKYIFGCCVILSDALSALLYLSMVIYGNTLVRILSFIPCTLLCGCTIMLILAILLNKTNKEKNDGKN